MNHKLYINGTCQLPEDGFVLGNGDLSVSCYQKPGKIVFQFGKNDFWDLRLDLSKNPRPAHIDELRNAIENGVQVDGVTNEVKGVAPEDCKRIKELTTRVPSQCRNAPMPKPAVKLHLNYPADWWDCQWKQILDIESGLLTLICHHFDGVELVINAAIHPENNRFSLNWQICGFSPDKLYGGYFFGLPELPKVYATLFREDEKCQAVFADDEMLEHGNNYFACADPFPPLPPSDVCNNVLTQQIPDGKTLFAAISGDGKCVSVKDKFLRLMPEMTSNGGTVFVGISTSDADEANSLAADGNCEVDFAEAKNAAEKFWQKSGVRFQDELLEKCWYASMHVKRCILRAGSTPPGLFLPSTLRDFSQWKGDYHFNYNYQSIFLGDYEANHIDTGDCYFDGSKYMIALGEKISREYYGIPDGCFIQLCGYPMYADDDYFGALPLGRMAYMTGWMAAYYFRRWDLTRDLEFLKKQAYPLLKKFAGFYAGFLKKSDDGIYHAFPSNQGESTFSKEGATDQIQVLMHGKFALLAAAKAAKILNIDGELADKWQHIAENMPWRDLEDYPEFEAFDGVVDDPDSLPDFLTVGNRFHDFYFGQMPYKFMIRLRRNIWKSQKWHDDLLTFLRRWTLPNGTLRAMSACTHYYRGGWTESLGIVGALNEMLMTSVKGVIRLFPGIPENKSASFTSLRASGAFLVSAEKVAGSIQKVVIHSEAGGICRLINPWKNAKILEKNLLLEGDTISFETLPGEIITLIPA